VRVPLVVREPRGATRLRAVARDAPMSTLDLAPTLLDLLGQPPEPAFRGQSLLRGARGAAEPLFSLGAYGSELLEKSIGTQFSARRGPWRYVLNSRDGSEELYDHRHDPGEARNVAAAHPSEREVLRAAVAGLRAEEARRAAPVETTPEHERALRALGYVQ
jgi:iduronate 2-sulfatase